MVTTPSAFSSFAPAILNIYRRDKEAFWAAVMAPFLANSVSLLDWWQHLKVDAGLLEAFRGLDKAARNVLSDFSAPLGFDVSQWKSSRTQYLKDAYPVFAFLAVWMGEENLSDYLDQFGDILRAGVYAVAGYGILDVNVDGASSSPVEILTAQALIAEYETLALQIFGVSEVNLRIMHQMRSLFLQAEIKEKFQRGKASPYRLDHPEECGAKGANAVAPFMLSLERIGKSGVIKDYWQVFLLFGAAIQMIDDWEDLESDLAVGHFSYVTLGLDKLPDLKDPKKAARLLRANHAHVRATYDRSKEMIARSRAILASLNDTILVRLVDVTELRLDRFFRKEFHLP
ncbi:MAG TPA: hypothetical protein VIO61_00965 [Anaerolineaceae bacterium]